MERVSGIILRSDLPAELGLDATRTEALCKSFIDKFVELHQVDYTACGLADLGKPEAMWRGRFAAGASAMKSPDARCAKVGGGTRLAQRQDASRSPPPASCTTITASTT